MITIRDFYGGSVLLEDAEALGLTGHPWVLLYALAPNANTTFRLPNATFMRTGAQAVLVVNFGGSGDTTIQDYDGGALNMRDTGAGGYADVPAVIGPGEMVYCNLLDRTTSAGSWFLFAAEVGAASGGLPAELVYLMGHNQLPAADGRIDQYRQDSDTWSNISSLPTFQSEGRTFRIGLSGYIAGGGGNSDATFAFDPPVVTARSNIGAGGVPNDPHRSPFGFHNTAAARGYVTKFSTAGDDWYAYNAVADTYTNEGSFPEGNNSGTSAVAFPGGAESGGRTFIVGGLDAGGIETGRNIEYVPTTSTFNNALAPMSSPRASFGCFGFTAGGMDFVAACGGHTGGLNAPIDACEAYSLTAGTWSPISALPQTRGQLAGVAADGRYFAGLGTTAGTSGTSEDWFEYNAAADVWIAVSSFLGGGGATGGRANNAGIGIPP